MQEQPESGPGAGWMMTGIVCARLLEMFVPSPHHPPVGRAVLGTFGAAQRRTGLLPHTFRPFFFFNVKKLNARFEFLIRPSSSCHLFCFVMHYIQLHISNPQILPRHQHTCQAFTFRRRRIKGLFLSRLLAPRHGMPSGPQQLPYSDPKAAPTPSTRTKPLQQGPGEAPAPMLGAGCSAQHLSGGDSISPISHSA